ncbi:MAG: VOC family protein [Acidimicrobiales bacterium]
MPTVRGEADSIAKPGLTHVGLPCDDLDTTRAELEGRGVAFLTSGIADVAGLRTTWCSDPWGTVIILLEKSVTNRPYWRQFDS